MTDDAARLKEIAIHAHKGWQVSRHHWIVVEGIANETLEAIAIARRFEAEADEQAKIGIKHHQDFLKAWERAEKAEADRSKFEGYLVSANMHRKKLMEERDAALKRVEELEAINTVGAVGWLAEHLRKETETALKAESERDAALAKLATSREIGKTVAEIGKLAAGELQPLLDRAVKAEADSARLAKRLDAHHEGDLESHNEPGKCLICGEALSPPQPPKPEATCNCKMRGAVQQGDCVQGADGIWHWKECPKVSSAPKPEGKCDHDFPRRYDNKRGEICLGCGHIFTPSATDLEREMKTTPTVDPAAVKPARCKCGKPADHHQMIEVDGTWHYYEPEREG